MKAVEIVVGDRVLMKNVRERGWTGKLHSYWEESLFQVVEKRDGIPVYKIQNIKKASDVRVVHRNLLMKCDQLPDNIFETPLLKKDKSKKRKRISRMIHEERKDNEEDFDSDDNAVIMERHYTEEISIPMEEVSVPVEECEQHLSHHLKRTIFRIRKERNRPTWNQKVLNQVTKRCWSGTRKKWKVDAVFKKGIWEKKNLMQRKEKRN